MAESGSSSNDLTSPPASSVAAVGAPDWELLSMSMSASALGKSRGDDRESSEIPNPTIESSSSSVPFNGALPSDAWNESLHANVNIDSSNDAGAEPFTEGWKPQLVVSSANLYGLVAERSREEGVHLPSEHAHAYFDDGNASLSISESLISSQKSEKFGADMEKLLLDSSHYADEGGIIILSGKERLKTGGAKRPRKTAKFIFSIAVAASFVGIFVLGRKLRTAYQQNEQLQIEVSAKEEKLSELLLQINRLKQVLIDHQRIPVSKK
ncbi:hypothetical protein KP509_04G015300 [Ceratopteris richardii]|uniref:Uncharacterized protein n=1 Tax=Ceratopteris richardii TaxID=49495 RepID=A0A8T2UX18_CERRI|nr:hypothetical protein KP509_04G015300 [Ceratopteris richardii]